MRIPTLKVVAFIGFSQGWCAGVSADDKPKTGFVNKTFTDKEGKADFFPKSSCNPFWKPMVDESAPMVKYYYGSFPFHM
jgi:hypothetical protein